MAFRPAGDFSPTGRRKSPPEAKKSPPRRKYHRFDPLFPPFSMSCAEPPTERDRLPPENTFSVMPSYIFVVKMARSAGGLEEIVKMQVFLKASEFFIYLRSVGDNFHRGGRSSNRKQWSPLAAPQRARAPLLGSPSFLDNMLDHADGQLFTARRDCTLFFR